MDNFEGGKPVVISNGTWLQRLTIEFRWYFGALLNWLGVPGYVATTVVYDQLTNTQIKVETQQLFTVISIDDRDYYFRRLDGKYDGSGKSL